MKKIEYYVLDINIDDRSKLIKYFEDNFLKIINKNGEKSQNGTGEYLCGHLTIARMAQLKKMLLNGEMDKLREALYTLKLYQARCSLYPNDPIYFEVDAIGVSNKAIAFRARDVCSLNKIPHITLKVFNGGSPKDSNDITEWHEIKPITVRGYFGEYREISGMKAIQ